MIKAIIIDDEPLAHNILLKYAEDIHDLQIIGQYYLAMDAYPILHEGHIDLMFLDINMPKLKGLDFLKALQARPAVVVTSAYEEYALEGFELQVTDYLLKPIRFERFLKAVNVVREGLVSKVGDSGIDHIFIKVDKKQLRLSLTEIQYIESYGNYVKVWVGDSFHLTPATLSSFEYSLGESFVRIHKSYVIQKNQIDTIEGNSVQMKNGNLISFGKNYRGVLKSLLG